MTPISSKRHRFSPEIMPEVMPEILQHAVWLYAKFTLSFCDVEDLLTERDIDIYDPDNNRIEVALNAPA